MLSRCIVYPSSTECNEYQYEDDVPYIVDEVMSEKVHIYTNRDEYRIYLLWVSSELEVKNPPHSCDITPDSRIHESREEGDRHDTYRESFWIAP